MNARTDRRSAADLERQGERIRANLDDTLDQIQRKFSSGELLDRSMEFIRDTGSEFLREAADTVRRNPVPAALTAAGLIWLATSVARSRSDYGYMNREPDWSRDEDTWDASAHGRVSNVAHKVRRKARRARSKVTDRFSEPLENVQSRARRASSNFAGLVREQPLALGALALAAGAMIGAALPMTEAENKWVGPVHDRTVARAKEVGQREYENLREAVTSSLERRSNGRGASGSDGGSQQQRPLQG
nr:hypothetical protein [uncultured Steroidobacter sp.]